MRCPMIKQLLQHLDSLQVDLAAIDPNPELEVADRVAAIAFAFRRAVETTEVAHLQAGIPGTAAAQRTAA